MLGVPMVGCSVVGVQFDSATVFFFRSLPVPILILDNHSARFDCPESRLGLANFGKRIPSRYRIEPQLRYSPPLVRRASVVPRALRRGVKRERTSATIGSTFAHQ